MALSPTYYPPEALHNPERGNWKVVGSFASLQYSKLGMPPIPHRWDGVLAGKTSYALHTTDEMGPESKQAEFPCKSSSAPSNRLLDALVLRRDDLLKLWRPMGAGIVKDKVRSALTPSPQRAPLPSALRSPAQSTLMRAITI
ncbi:hypothetical protein M407DRAFT_25057 [Tulasnella calospora MUT 4182]|uniref:Uncharacterized protein n=1 Tax=Tulasnella calospora MUT 4182 TaxID=1051891 RepID=A0A0C3KVP7_9AGAM|nr:hypothetical protein M407DRAFT_25057 [Tulasnella calospora MUT 4182]